MGGRRIVLLLLLMVAAGQACAQPPAAPTAAEPLQRIFVPPPVQWDQAMLSFHPALQQSATDFANLTDGIAFGMSPEALIGKLSASHAGVSWTDLPLAGEYPGEVHYLGLPLAKAGALRMNVAACAGATSYIAFLFDTRGLVRLSYRLAADKGCPDPAEAGREIFGRYVTIGPGVALSVRYRTGKTEVVDVSDPTAGYLIPVRWRQGSR